MLNEITLNPGTISQEAPTLEALPQEVRAEIERFKRGEIDNLIIHGFPTPADLPPTPSAIREAVQGSFPARLLENVGRYLGKISPKGIENTIRFRTGDLGIVNEETWHGHYQYQYTLFFCLRGDPSAKTYFFSANSYMAGLPEDKRQLLLSPFAYSADRDPFALIEKHSFGYALSHHIYDRSDFERFVKDLDLPDVVKALEKLSGRTGSKEADKAVAELLSALKDSKPAISYKPGDVALYDERSTIRFSPSYLPSTPQSEDRWILALTVEG